MQRRGLSRRRLPTISPTSSPAALADASTPRLRNAAARHRSPPPPARSARRAPTRPRYARSRLGSRLHQRAQVAGSSTSRASPAGSFRAPPQWRSGCEMFERGSPKRRASPGAATRRPLVPGPEWDGTTRRRGRDGAARARTVACVTHARGRNRLKTAAPTRAASPTTATASRCCPVVVLIERLAPLRRRWRRSPPRVTNPHAVELRPCKARKTAHSMARASALRSGPCSHASPASWL